MLPTVQRSSEMQDQSEIDSGWTQCRPGEISDMVAQIKRRKKIVTIQFTVGTTLSILLVLTVFALSRPAHFDFGGITCAEVHEHNRAFVAGELSVELTNQIKTHLSQCPDCGPRFRQTPLAQTSHPSVWRRQLPEVQDHFRLRPRLVTDVQTNHGHSKRSQAAASHFAMNTFISITSR
jgi:hypothetical protein